MGVTRVKTIGDRRASGAFVKSLAAPDGQRILLIGGAGFIGAALAQRLVARNEVVIFDSFHRNSLRHTELADGHPHLTLIRGDVLNPHDLDRLRGRFDVVFHLAAIAGVGTVVEEPGRTLHVNLIGTYHVLRHFVHQPIGRFVAFSTSEVYGPFNFRAGEEDATAQGPVSQPRWVYAISKLASEHLTLGYHREFGMPAATVRPFNIYGPGQVGEGAIHHFVRAALRGEPLIVHGDGNPVRSWCFIDDAVDCCLRIATDPAALGQCFNVGNPQATCTVLRLAQDIVRMTGGRSRIEFREIAHPDVQVRVPSIERAHRQLGYWPRVGLDEGLARTLEWYRRHEDTATAAGTTPPGRAAGTEAAPHATATKPADTRMRGREHLSRKALA
jgi:nucleoside-diphosphate-sugar epimerase